MAVHHTKAKLHGVLYFAKQARLNGELLSTLHARAGDMAEFNQQERQNALLDKKIARLRAQLRRRR